MWRAITPIWVSSYCHTVILFLIFLVSMTMGIMVQAPNLYETAWGKPILFFFLRLAGLAHEVLSPVGGPYP